MTVEVECYAGRKGDERPVLFRVDGREYRVQEVMEQWYEPDSECFKVRSADGGIHVLRHATAADDWSIEKP